MTDNMKDAVEAAAKQHSPHLWGGRFRAALLQTKYFTSEQADEGVEKNRAEILAEAEEYITAAEPHLRRKWAEEIREGVNPPDTGKAHEWRRGFITGVLRTARFLEGARE